MFDDYVLYLLESLHCQERANELMRAMKGEGSTGEFVLLFIFCCFVPLDSLFCTLGTHFYPHLTQRRLCRNKVFFSFVMV